MMICKFDKFEINKLIEQREDSDENIYGDEYKEAEEILRAQGYSDSEIKQLGSNTMSGLTKLTNYIASDAILPSAMRDAFQELGLEVVGDYLSGLGPEGAPDYPSMRAKMSSRNRRAKERIDQLRRESKKI